MNELLMQERLTAAWAVALYRKYLPELKTLTVQLAHLWESGQFKGPRGTADLEGEIYYMLCREVGANHILEMASAAGWSTLYLGFAALKNGYGNGTLIHSFEMDKDHALRYRENVIPRFSFAWLHEGDCKEVVRRIAFAQKRPFDFVLLDVHMKDVHRFAFQQIFPQTRGVVVIDDLVPDLYPRNHPEPVFFLWLLLRGGIPFLTMASLLENEEIQQMRSELTPRYPKGPAVDSAKGVIFFVEGDEFKSPLWQKWSEIGYDQFPPRAMEQYSRVPERFKGASFTELLRELGRRVASKWKPF